MADDSIRTLFDKVDGLTIQTTRIETLLVENVIIAKIDDLEFLKMYQERRIAIYPHSKLVVELSVVDNKEYHIKKVIRII